MDFVDCGALETKKMNWVLIYFWIGILLGGRCWILERVGSCHFFFGYKLENEFRIWVRWKIVDRPKNSKNINPNDIILEPFHFHPHFLNKKKNDKFMDQFYYFLFNFRFSWERNPLIL